MQSILLAGAGVAVAGLLALSSANTSRSGNAHTMTPDDPPASNPASRPASQPAMPKSNILGTEKQPPARVKVAHILISFAGAGTSAKRSKADAEKLAWEIYQKIQGGAEFDTLMKSSDDPGPGKYGMFTDPKAKKGDDYPRAGMVGAFGDVGFTLQLNEVGLAVHDPARSPFGWHIIKRIE